MEWYQKDIPQTFQELTTSEEGLSYEDAKNRLEEYGSNKLPEQKTDSILKIFFKQFESPLIYLLLVVAMAVFFIGEISDGIIIMAVLIFNAIMGSIQEGRANRTLIALKRISATQAVVLRDGQELFISDEEVVPGDIIILREGEKVPSDARVIKSNSLKLDEAILTGESVPVHKISEVLRGNLEVADRKNMVFKGTNVMAGNGLAVAVATGLNTEIGKISSAIVRIDTEIPLKKEIRDLSRTIIYVAGIIAGILFTVGIANERSPVDMFATVVSLTVSIIPEGLPVVMTLVLATGVWKMSKRNALVKKLQAVEALGQATVLAIDKTGTITKNELVIRTVFINNDIFEISGIGYESKGDVMRNGEVISPANHPDLMFAGKIASYCANSTPIFSEDTKMWKVTGDPTEAALRVFGEKVGFNKFELEQESPMLFEIPFDYKNKYHVTVHKTDGRKFLSVVGAPEQVLGISSSVWIEGNCKPISENKRKELEIIFSSLSSQGLRVLAFGFEPDFRDALDGNIKDICFAGFFGMKDTIRPEVPGAVAKAREAGLKVVMITGDHKITAIQIAKDAGIFKDGDHVITGEELDSMNDSQLCRIIQSISVFARVTPEHKLKIISAYRKNGHIVAMTGDGVNDAPSLVGADLGIAMGKMGSEVSKEAADIVLLDDNLSSVIAAIEEGRSIYKTVKKVILYLFSTSAGEVLTISGALLLGLAIPVLPAQIIWLNLVTDGFLTVALAMEPKESNLLNQKRRGRDLVDKLMVQRSIFMSLVMAIGTLFIFRSYLNGSDIAKAQTMALTVLAVFQWFNAWNCRSDSASVFKTNPFSNKFLVGALFIIIALQVLAVYHPFMQNILHTTSITFAEWLLIAAVAMLIIFVEDIRKAVYNKKR